MKSHFKFTRGQQNGIFLLLVIVIVLQSAYYLIDSPQPKVEFDQSKLLAFQKELDSLSHAALEIQKPTIFPFNPNYITDYKGYTLGMSVNEIDRLIQFRANNNWINSTQQFQDVTKVSDSLLSVISPYFKFPEWVTNTRSSAVLRNSYSNRIRSYEEKIDLNNATAHQLKRVNGIGDKLSDRIIKFRNSFNGGFIADVQLHDVYGLSPEVIQRITNEFTVKTPRQIVKKNINEATIEELVKIQHIDYELAYEIIDQRILREGFKSLDELTKVKDFPESKFEIIKLYLTLE